MEMTMSRRAALASAFATSAAVVLPFASPTAADTVSAIPSLEEAFRRACVAYDQAMKTAEVHFEQMNALSKSDPIMVRLPGFRTGNMRNVDQLTRTDVEDLYRREYGFRSGKSGARLVNGKFVVNDYAADLEKDLAEAVENHRMALEYHWERSMAVGESAALDALSDAQDDRENALLALVSYVPKHQAEAEGKSAALQRLYEAQPDIFQTGVVQALIVSIGAA